MSRVRRYSRSGLTAVQRRSPTGLSPPAVTRSSGLRLNPVRAARRLPPPPAHSSNPPQASPAGYTARGVWAPPRSLAATKGILSVPRGTEMFQFPRCPLRDCSQSARPCAGRVAPFGHPRIAGCQRLPGAFRRVAASFLGRQRQGIHHAPIMRISCVRSPPGAVVTTPADRLAPAGRFRLAAAPLCCRTPALPRWVVVCVCVFLYCSVCVFDGTLQCARASRHEPPHPTGLPVWSRTRVTMSRRDVRRTPSGHRRLPRPQNPAGSARRFVKVPEDPIVVLTTQPSSQQPAGLRVFEVVKPRPKPSSDLGRDLPTHTRSS